MRETDFVKQNKENWAELEQILSLKNKDPDKLSNLFIQVTDDLSYSRTFYKNRSVKVYLNNIAQQVFHSIYKNKKDRRKQFVLFWKEELPQIVYESRKELLLSLIVFMLAALIGVISYANDPEFAHIILGKQYIEMTNANIKGGDPMAVYKKMNQVDMFLGISLNNLFVAFRTFILGVFFAIGTLAIMIYNGIMIGVFQYFFYQKGLFMESFLAIWLHGTLEISSIIIAGGAGLTLGKGLVFPGTLSRLQAFQLSARRGLKLLLSIVPILIFAAIIESFVTRYTDAPNLLRFIIILFSFLFIIGYFIWYPLKKAKKGFSMPINEGKLSARIYQKINFTEIKSNGEIFTGVFVFYRKKLKPILMTVFLFSILYTTTALLIYPFLLDTRFYSSNYFFIFKLFNYKHIPFLALLNTIIFSVPAFVINFFLNNESERDETKNKLTLKYVFRNYYKSFLICGMLNSLLFLPAPFNVLLFICALPFSWLWQFIAVKEKGTLFNSLKRTFSLSGDGLGKFLGLYLMLAFVGMVYFLLIDSPLVYFYFEILNWNLSIDSETAQQLFVVLMIFTSIAAFQLLIPILCAGKGILYFSLKEIKEADGLKERIKIFGTKKR